MKGFAVGFRDRAEAGRLLASELAKFADAEPIVLALPRGGVAVAAEISAALGAPLELVLVRKIGVPFQPELAMGAVVDGPEPIVVRNEDVIALAHVGEAEFAAARDRALGELARRRRLYLAGRAPMDVGGRTAIVVDDGIATGATVRAALRAVRLRKPERLVLAVPVAPPETLAGLAAEADEIVCLERPPAFGAIGSFYANFRQLSDEDVLRALAKVQDSMSSSIPG